MNIQLFFQEHPVISIIFLFHVPTGLIIYWSTLLKNEYKGLKKIITERHAAGCDSIEMMLYLMFFSFGACLGGYFIVPYLIIERYRKTLPAPPPPKETRTATS